MTAEPLPRSPAEHVRSDLAAADADVDDDRHHRRRAAMSPVNRDADPWMLPQLALDDSPHWSGTLDGPCIIIRFRLFFHTAI